MEKLLSPEDVCDVLGISVDTLYSWRSRGKAPRAIKVGKHLRFRAEDVERFIAERAA